MLTLVSTIVVLGMLVFFHELGHFAVAKAVGIKVYEFSMGFGPKLFGFRSGDTRYNVRVFPLGGFVRMAGMDRKDDEAEAAADGQEEGELNPEGSFAAKTILQRMAVIAAGPIMNFILAALPISIVIRTGPPSCSAGISWVSIWPTKLAINPVTFTVYTAPKPREANTPLCTICGSAGLIPIKPAPEEGSFFGTTCRTSCVPARSTLNCRDFSGFL